MVGRNKLFDYIWSIMQTLLNNTRFYFFFYFYFKTSSRVVFAKA